MSLKAELEEVRRLADRLTGVVHVGRGLEQDHPLALQRAFGGLALKAAAPRSKSVTPRDLVDDDKADVVPVTLVLRTRIAEPHEETHDAPPSSAYFFWPPPAGALAAPAAGAAAAPAAGRGGSASRRSGSRTFRRRSSGCSGGLQLFGVARRRHDRHQRRVGTRHGLGAGRQRDVRQMQRVIDLKAGDVDLDELRNVLDRRLQVDGVRDDVDRAAALDAGRGFRCPSRAAER